MILFDVVESVGLVCGGSNRRNEDLVGIYVRLRTNEMYDFGDVLFRR